MSCTIEKVFQVVQGQNLQIFGVPGNNTQLSYSSRGVEAMSMEILISKGKSYRDTKRAFRKKEVERVKRILLLEGDSKTCSVN